MPPSSFQKAAIISQNQVFVTSMVRPTFAAYADSQQVPQTMAIAAPPFGLLPSSQTLMKTPPPSHYPPILIENLPDASFLVHATEARWPMAGIPIASAIPPAVSNTQYAGVSHFQSDVSPVCYIIGQYDAASQQLVRQQQQQQQQNAIYAHPSITADLTGFDHPQTVCIAMPYGSGTPANMSAKPHSVLVSAAMPVTGPTLYTDGKLEAGGQPVTVPEVTEMRTGYGELPEVERIGTLINNRLPINAQEYVAY